MAVANGFFQNGNIFLFISSTLISNTIQTAALNSELLAPYQIGSLVPASTIISHLPSVYAAGKRALNSTLYTVTGKIVGLAPPSIHHYGSLYTCDTESCPATGQCFLNIWREIVRAELCLSCRRPVHAV